METFCFHGLLILKGCVSTLGSPVFVIEVAGTNQQSSQDQDKQQKNEDDVLSCEVKGMLGQHFQGIHGLSVGTPLPLFGMKMAHAGLPEEVGQSKGSSVFMQPD